MARHRRRPVPRHQARRSGGNSAAAQPPDRRLGTAMRRVVVTPTFAAGLGVVVAAVLAYPMHTVFSYAGAQRRHLQGASSAGCTPGQWRAGRGQGKPAPAASAAGPAHRLARDPAARTTTPQPATSGRAAPVAPTGRLAAAEVPDRQQGAGRVQRGDHDHVPPGTVPAHWQLRFGYPSAASSGHGPRHGHLGTTRHAATVSVRGT